MKQPVSVQAPLSMGLICGTCNERNIRIVWQTGKAKAMLWCGYCVNDGEVTFLGSTKVIHRDEIADTLMEPKA